jgi:hypothetical protein
MDCTVENCSPSSRSARFASPSLLFLAAFVTLAACTSDDGNVAPIPAKADSGFSLATNAFGFENFADGYAESRITTASMVRMFGTDGVCAAKSTPCMLLPAASAWMNRVNASMAGGRCEGFAVLSSLFYLGALDPTTFGAVSPRQLTLDGNIALQGELAYWFATQDAPSIGSKSQKLGATDALRFLSTFLKPGADESYRIGMVRKTKNGISGGHALTPISYAQTSKAGVYKVHVYDNNFPNEDRTMTIDVNLGRWEYHASANPMEAAALYFGDATNNNPLYFAPIKPRVGQLAVPFGKGAAQSQTIFHGAVQVMAQDAAGSSAGIAADGSIVEQGTGTLSPSMSSVNTWSGSVPITLLLPTGNTTLTVTGSDDTSFGPADLSQFGSGYAVQATNLSLAPGAADTLALLDGGRKVTYDDKSGTPIALDVSVTKDDGGVLQVHVDVPAHASTVGTQIDPASGKINVTANGTDGQTVTITVTKVDGTSGESVTGTITTPGSATSSVAIDTSMFDAMTPLTGVQDIGNGPMSMVAASCTDGIQNGQETDIDCGGTCAKTCAVAQGCAFPADCASGFCNGTSGKCVASACFDGVASAGEVDVDCGGTCTATCDNGKACNAPADCTSGICTTSICESADRKLFVSSQTFDGNLGGLAGADAKCQTLATAAHLPGAYKAFLSDSTTNAQQHVPANVNKFVLVDGTVIANDSESFFAMHLANIDRTESGATKASASVWTGSSSSGISDATGQCSDWTSNAAGNPQAPSTGLTSQSGARWANDTTKTCDQSLSLYCIEQ